DRIYPFFIALIATINPSQGNRKKIFMAGPLKSGKIKSSINLSKKKFAIVVAEWNEEITEALYEGAISGLISNGVKKENVIRKNVPGTFELSLGALYMADKKEIHAVICLGCVIQGETP